MEKIVDCKTLIQPLAKGIAQCQYSIEGQARQLYKNALEREHNSYAKFCLEQIIENAQIAQQTLSPACQDSGLAVFFVKIGQDVRLKGMLIEDALNQAVRNAHKEGYLRMSTADPLTRINTGDNTPAIIHTQIVKGNGLSITYLAKGAGSENMSKLYMLAPAKGKQGIIDSVLDCISCAGANPCPPIVAGVGIGGTMEKAALLAKYALTRQTGTPNTDAQIAALEAQILQKINALKIGVQGFGGDNTALAVHIESFPTHIGMLPVAVNIQCHSIRHFSFEL